MQRLFNARQGRGAMDELPKKLFKPLTGGPSDGLHVTEEQMEQALDRYYAMAVLTRRPACRPRRRWTATGWIGATHVPGAHPLPHTGGLNLPAGSTASK